MPSALHDEVNWFKRNNCCCCCCYSCYSVGIKYGHIGDNKCIKYAIFGYSWSTIDSGQMNIKPGDGHGEILLLDAINVVRDANGRHIESSTSRIHFLNSFQVVWIITITITSRVEEIKWKGEMIEVTMYIVFIRKWSIYTSQVSYGLMSPVCMVVDH